MEMSDGGVMLTLVFIRCYFPYDFSRQIILEQPHNPRIRCHSRLLCVGFGHELCAGATYAHSGYVQPWSSVFGGFGSTSSGADGSFTHAGRTLQPSVSVSGYWQPVCPCNLPQCFCRVHGSKRNAVRVGCVAYQLPTNWCSAPKPPVGLKPTGLKQIGCNRAWKQWFGSRQAAYLLPNHCFCLCRKSYPAKINWFEAGRGRSGVWKVGC